MDLKLKFIVEKETKGAVRFQEVGDDGKPAFSPAVGALYIRKSAMSDGKVPDKLELHITSDAAKPAKGKK